MALASTPELYLRIRSTGVQREPRNTVGWGSSRHCCNYRSFSLFRGRERWVLHLYPVH